VCVGVCVSVRELREELAVEGRVVDDVPVAVGLDGPVQVCVECVCVCEREIERGRGTEGRKDGGTEGRRYEGTKGEGEER
jgi:hypothetical protein